MGERRTMGDNANINKLEDIRYGELIDISFRILNQYYPEVNLPNYLISILNFLCMYEARLEGTKDDELAEISVDKLKELKDEELLENLYDYTKKISDENIKYSILYAFLGEARNQSSSNEDNEPQRMFG